MRILIIGYGKLKYMPYVNFYLDNIDCKTNDVHLVYWNRDQREEDTSKYNNVKLHEFSFFQKSDVGLLKKFSGFKKFRAFILKTLSEMDFDYLVILHTITGYIIRDRLKKKYKNRYILDYRDSTYEKFWFFRKAIKKMSDDSSITFTSSDAFRKYLSVKPNKVLTSHNLLLDSLNHRDYEKTGGKVIRISFWGLIRDIETNRLLIQRIGNDNRFELHYYGREEEQAKKLRLLVEHCKISNVFFHGEYVPSDRYEFVKNTDLIHNLYCDHNTLLAMGNKYYDGIIFRIPQLCYPGSFMGKRVTMNGIGFECDPNSLLFADNVYKYYTNIFCKEERIRQFKDACDSELNAVLKDYKNGSFRIKTIFKEQ